MSTMSSEYLSYQNRTKQNRQNTNEKRKKNSDVLTTTKDGDNSDWQ